MEAINHIGEFISQLATKAGLKADDPHLVNFLSSTKLSEINIPAELVTALDNSLLTVDMAKNNHPKVKGHYTQQALATVDKKIEELLAASKLPDAKKTELAAIGSTYDRLTSVIQAVAEAAPAPAGKPAAGDAAAQQVQTLLNEINELKTKHASELNAAKAAHDTDVLRYEKIGKIGKYKTTFDDLEANARSQALLAIIDTKLAAMGASFVRTENGIELRGPDGTTVLNDAHQAYTPDTFIESTLANSKVLTVADAAQEQQNNQGGAAGAGAAAKTIQAQQNGPQGNNQGTLTANLNRQARQNLDKVSGTAK